MPRRSKKLPTDDQNRLDEHMAGIRDLERAIAALPEEYRRVEAPDFDGDMKTGPGLPSCRAIFSCRHWRRQTRVASYMLTKCQSIRAFPGSATPRLAITTTPTPKGA
jgi:hypothetical protein